MKALITNIFLLLTICCVSQKTNVVELYVLREDTGSVWSSHELRFPYVITMNKAAQLKINQAILEQIFDSQGIDFSDTNSIKQAIDTQAAEYISEVSFEVMLSSNNWLQLSVTHSGVAAYSFDYTNFFFFNTQTGQRYMLIDLIKPDKQMLFSDMIFADQKDSLNSYLLNIKKELLDMGAEDDSSTIKEISDLVKQCYDYMDGKSESEHYDFHLANDTLLIETSCGFPRYARVFQPYYRIPYAADYIKDYLLPEIYQQLVSQKANK